MAIEQTVGITFGAMPPRLDEQLAARGYRLHNADHHQGDADAITRLAIRGMLSEAEVHRARKRLTTAILADAHHNPIEEAGHDGA